MSEVVSETRQSRRTLGVLKNTVVTILGASMALALISMPASAFQNTWKAMAHFNQTIGCGFFFDEDHGLIGSGVRWDGQNPGKVCAIYKTTDGGATWTTSIVPTSIVGAVTSIWMQDTLVGYASIFPAVNYSLRHTFGGSSLWETTDGGDTWFDPFHLDHAITSVYGQNGLLLITKWDVAEYSSAKPPDILGGNYSYDGGATWTPNFRRCNGIAFSDSLNGVISEMNDFNPGDNFWVTTDAGRTWQATSNQYEAWSVHALAGQGIYLCANESQLNIPYKSINWSTDGGFTWQQRASFPFMHFTGAIGGVEKTLYFQTDSVDYGDGGSFNSGMYRSDDTGATWHWVAGPTNSRDTRFVVTGCEGEVVYAFDGYGNVWKTTDGGDGSMLGSFALNADTISWTPNPCGDTISFYAFGVNCLPSIIDSVSILSGTEFMKLPNASTLPQEVTNADSALITLIYSPTTGGQESSVVRIYGHSGELTVMRDVNIITNNSLPNAMYISTDTSRLNAVECDKAIDTIYLANLGCSGMILDSVTLPMGKVIVSTLLPTPIPDNDSFPLAIEFLPDSAGVVSPIAYVYAHIGRRNYDTTITVIARSTPQPLAFGLDSNAISFETKYCESAASLLSFATTSCHTVVIDSIVCSNSNFAIQQTSSVIASGSRDSLTVTFNPDSPGISTGIVRLFANDGTRSFDTTINLIGINYSLPQEVTLSRTSISLSTQGCQGLWDTLLISDQGCDSLYLDSAIIGDSEIGLTYQKQLLPLNSGDSLMMQVAFMPEDGVSKTIPMHLFMHTKMRLIDSTITVDVSNAIPSPPLELSTDSIFLFTRYCQPVSLPLTIDNFGCPDMIIDSVTVLGNSRNEFGLNGLDSQILSQKSDSASAIFTPDSAGQREVSVKIFFSAAGKSFDTILSIVGKNLVAPVPYIPPLPHKFAGDSLLIPIMLEPTADTFSIRSYNFHLSFNTDMLTPLSLVFDGTCSQNVTSSHWTEEPGDGVSGTVTMSNAITNASQLDLPLVYVLARVYLTKDTITPVILDTFVTDVTKQEAAIALCNYPEQPFQIDLKCGDPLLSELLLTGTVSFNFVSVAPNPAGQEREWNVDYTVNSSTPGFTLDVYNAIGAPINHLDNLPAGIGEHHIGVAIPQSGGDYFLVLGNPHEKSAKMATVVR